MFGELRMQAIKPCKYANLPMQLCQEKGQDLSVCVIEKGAEVGKCCSESLSHWLRACMPLQTW